MKIRLVNLQRAGQTFELGNKNCLAVTYKRLFLLLTIVRRFTVHHCLVVSPCTQVYLIVRLLFYTLIDNVDWIEMAVSAKL